MEELKRPLTPPPPIPPLLLPEGPSPPHSPDLGGAAASSRSVRDSKENKEPSPKMRRRRSVKISSITLEATQWQNDALHILTSTHDYRSMNDFLMKKVRAGEEGGGRISELLRALWWFFFFFSPGVSVVTCAQISDLESEDGKNDTMVDVVFKKALKEFRINIFNSYSTALAVSARFRWPLPHQSHVEM